MFSRPEMGDTRAENPPDTCMSQNPPVARNSVEYTRELQERSTIQRYEYGI
jgi:hypothetical protein